MLLTSVSVGRLYDILDEEEHPYGLRVSALKCKCGGSTQRVVTLTFDADNEKHFRELLEREPLIRNILNGDYAEI